MDIREYPKFFSLYSKFYKILTDKLLNKNKFKCFGTNCVTKTVGTLNAKIYSMKAEIVELERQLSRLIPYENKYTLPFKDMPTKPVIEMNKISHLQHSRHHRKLIPPNIAQCLIDNSKAYYEQY